MRTFSPLLNAVGRSPSVRDAKAALSLIAVVSGIAFGVALLFLRRESTNEGARRQCVAGRRGIWHSGRGHTGFQRQHHPSRLPPGALRALQRDASNPRLLSCYPDSSARRLRHALSQKLNVSPDAIAVGPGAASLLAPILGCLKLPASKRRALVPVHGFQ